MKRDYRVSPPRLPPTLTSPVTRDISQNNPYVWSGIDRYLAATQLILYGCNSFLCSTMKYGSILISILPIRFSAFHRTIPVQYDSLQPCFLKDQPKPETYLPLDSCSNNSMPPPTGSSPGPKRKAGGERLEPYFCRPQLTRFFSFLHTFRGPTMR